MICILDSHILIWMFGDKSRLSEKALESIISGDSRLVIPAIALAEVKYLEFRNRIPISYRKLRAQIGKSRRFSVHPVTEEIVDLLPDGFTLHDGIILATALFFRNALGEDVELITSDRELRESGLVKTVW